jgi:hypothetical protein
MLPVVECNVPILIDRETGHACDHYFQNHFRDPDDDLCCHLGIRLPGRLPLVRRRLLPRLVNNPDERLGQRRRSCASGIWLR